jgi:spermidine synthase
MRPGRNDREDAATAGAKASLARGTKGPQARRTAARRGGAIARVTEWFTEQQTAHMRLDLRVARVLHRQRTRYQEVAVLESVQFGRMLALDQVIMLTEADEFVYHEMLVHPALLACAAPRRVLIVGGGDGGAARETLRHATVEEVVVAELDPDVVTACRRHLPVTAAAFDDPRVQVRPGDGAAFVARLPDGSFDAVLVDAPDPVGHAEPLFSPRFYAQCARILAPHGVLAAQSDSPFIVPQITRRTVAAFRTLFPVVRICWGVVPTYAGNLWTFTVGTRGADPAAAPPAERLAGLSSCRYWSPRLHAAAFQLPAFVERAVALGPDPVAIRGDLGASAQGPF